MEKKPGISWFKAFLWASGCWIAALGAFVLMILAGRGRPTNEQPRTDSSVQRPAASSRAWYDGGTLHRATLNTWLAASHENKLATASDWVASLKVGKSAVQSAGSMDALKPLAENLVACVDKATTGINQIKDWDAASVAASCTTIMGWE